MRVKTGLLERVRSGLIVDNFCGAGGASQGIEAALGRPVDFALNHSADAIRMHEVNHPDTQHITQDIWEVDPRSVAPERQLTGLWLSPDCKHFSRAKNGQLLDRKIRMLADALLPWLWMRKPLVFWMENVKEFTTWGPLKDGRLDKARAGEYFDNWLSHVHAAGYRTEQRIISACDHGAPTTRERWFMVGVREDQVEGIHWPEQTHGRGLAPYRTAGECLNLGHPTKSIFTRKKPLAEATLARMAKGIDKFVVNNPQPYIVRHGHYSTKTGAGMIPGRGAGTFRGQSLDAPLGTICATNDKNLVVPVIVKNNGGSIGAIGSDCAKPMHTITGKCQMALMEALLAQPGQVDRSGQVSAFLLKYYGQGVARSLDDPLGTITTRDRFGLVMVHGEPHRIVDIRYRMLQPDELFKAQGFRDDFKFTHDLDGEAFTQKVQIAMVGNSVSPPVAEAIVGGM